MKPPHRSIAILIVLAILMTAAIVYTAWSLGMSQRIHARYTYHAFPAVISYMFHGAPWDYTAYEGVARPLARSKRDGQVDLALKEASTLSLTEQDRTLRYFPYDDKGYADLTWLGFTLFGVAVASVFWGYCVLFAASVAVYLAGLWRDVSALALLNLTLAGFYVALFAFLPSTELGEITNPRAGLLSIVALTHLVYVALRRTPLGWIGLVSVGLQAALVAFEVFCRSPEAWQPALIVLVAIGSLIVAIRKRQSFSAPVFVVVSIFAVFTGLSVYQHAYFAPAYFSKYGQARLMWHNATLGLSLNPVLARDYGLDVSDGAMFKKVGERAKDQGTYDVIFGERDSLTNNPINDFSQYDSLARDIFLEIAAQRPFEVIKAFLIYKPIALVDTFRVAAGSDSTSPRFDFQSPSLAPGVREKYDAYYNPLRALPLLVVFICASIISLSAKAAEFYLPASTSGLVLLGSAIAPWASYPLYHVIGTMFATATTFVYVLIVYVIAAIAAPSAMHLRQYLFRS